MKSNHLVPAAVSIVCLAALTACGSETSTKSESTTTSTTHAVTAGAGSATSPQATKPAEGQNTGTAAAPAEQASSGAGPSAPAATSDPNNVSHLKPYAPPKMAPGFPGQGDPNAWKKATKFFNDGIDASSAKKYAEAVKLYKQAIATYPYDSNFYANLGFALERNGDPAAGVEACKKAIALSKDFGGAWENLGNCQYDLGKLKESRDAFNQALNCDLSPSKRNELLNVVSVLSKKIAGG